MVANSVTTEAGPVDSVFTRGKMLRRLGTVLVGASAASILTKQQAAVAAPQCCYGGSCYDRGCSCGTPYFGPCASAHGSSDNCWYCTQDPPNCRTWRCCDYTCGDSFCVCVTLMCNCC